MMDMGQEDKLEKIEVGQKQNTPHSAPDNVYHTIFCYLENVKPHKRPHALVVNI